jgi:diadenosine tetraphosphate (Ap4A) HIT family hydrolase
MRKQANNFSHLTAIDRIKLSSPVQFLLNQNLLTGRVLDFGCGLGNDVKFLQQKGLDITGYDPYYSPTYPSGKFDSIVCCYVLNVLMPEAQADALMNIAHLLKPGGKAYYAVRRDLKIYEYVHYNHQWNSPNNCIFCNPHRQLNLLTESATAYAMFDGYPLSRGHILIVPKRHVSNYFELPAKEQSACWLMANKVQDILTKEFQPDGFNIGMNINKAAGQAMNHATIHIIPRYHGDTDSKKSGMRFVIPKPHGK